MKAPKMLGLFWACLLVLSIGLLSSGCKKDEETTSPPQGPAAPTLTSNSFPGNAISVAPGSGPVSGKLQGGTPPYSITTPPNTAVATASVSNDTLIVTPMGTGTTTFTIADAAGGAGDSPNFTSSFTVTIQQAGGSMAHNYQNSTSGTFSAQGMFDSIYVANEGCGGFRYIEQGYDDMWLYGYKMNSANDISIAVVLFYSMGGLATGAYSFTPTSPTTFASLVFVPHYNPQDTSTSQYYYLTTGTATLTALTASNAQGTYSGNGNNSVQGTIAITSGQFNINYLTQSPPPIAIANNGIEAGARKVVQKILQERRQIK